MPFGVQKPFRRLALPKPEILAIPLETNVIESVVINASGIPQITDFNDPYYGRRYMIAGTVLSKRNDGTYERYVNGGGQNVAGILFDTVEFADNSAASDEPVAMLRRNVSFKAAAIVDYATYQAQITAALSTCEFI